MMNTYGHAQSCVYHGSIYHRRFKPKTHVFRYRVFSLYLDVDNIPATAGSLLLLSHNKWNIFSFYDTDVGEVGSENRDPGLRDYVERHLQAQGILQRPATIKLLCYPRLFGYVFNPLVIFYCENSQGELFAILNEVHNTFAERQVYVLALDNDSSAHNTFPCHTKAMYVSPFTPMKMHYSFEFNQPSDQLRVLINAYDEQGLMLRASMTGQRLALNNRSLLRCFFLVPLMSFKVIVGIHWEALRLWIKRVPWFSHQDKSFFQ